MKRIFAAVALLAVPLLCAELYFRLEAPGQGAGVYLEIDRDYKLTLDETDRDLYTLSGYASGQAGAANEALAKSPVARAGRRLAFFIVGPRNSPFLSSAPSAALWCYVVDPADDGFRTRAVPVPATIRQINPRAFRVTSEELEHVWAPERIAFQQYARALASTTAPRTKLEVMIGLELQESSSGTHRLYSVQVGPPR